MRHYAWLHCSDGQGKAHLHLIETDTEGATKAIIAADTGWYATACKFTGPSGSRPVTWGLGAQEICRRCFARWAGGSLQAEAPAIIESRP